MEDLLNRDRRSQLIGDDLSPDQLLQSQIDIAQRQLAAARDDLIAARRRVVALETAVQNWHELATNRNQSRAG